jgi:hypothetical protein
MFADTLLQLERGHLLRLGVWSVGSIFVGIVFLVLLARRHDKAPFIKHFAIQMLAWGAVDLALVLSGWHGLGFRDFQAALELQQFLWLNVGLDAGYIGIGMTLALAGWQLARRMGAVGAGVGISLQGIGLLVLDVRLLALIGPPR